MPQRVDFGRPIVERRQVERRKTHTMLDPTMDRRKSNRRVIRKPKQVKVSTDAKNERVEMLIILGMCLVALECWVIPFILR